MREALPASVPVPARSSADIAQIAFIPRFDGIPRRVICQRPDPSGSIQCGTPYIEMWCCRRMLGWHRLTNLLWICLTCPLRVLFQKVRKEPKRFTQRRPHGKDGWVYKLGDVRRVLYRL